MTAAAVVSAVLAGLAALVASARGPARGPARRGRPVGWLTKAQVVQTVKPAARTHAREVAALAAALSSELRAGRHPEQAWQEVVTGTGVELPGSCLPEADVVVVLDRWASRPGWGGLAAVAATWRLANTSGAGLADALDRVAESMRHEQEIAAEVQGQLSVTRATAALLAVLPLLAVAMGTLLGADPIGALVGSEIGRGCLAIGIALVALGWWWVARQVAEVHRTMRWQ